MGADDTVRVLPYGDRALLVELPDLAAVAAVRAGHPLPPPSGLAAAGYLTHPVPPNAPPPQSAPMVTVPPAPGSGPVGPGSRPSMSPVPPPMTMGQPRRRAPAWTLLAVASVLLLIVVAFLSSLYRFSPNVHLGWRDCIPGAVLGAALWIAAAVGFRLSAALGLRTSSGVAADDPAVWQGLLDVLPVSSPRRAAAAHHLLRLRRTR